VACGPPGLDGGKNILYHNNGDGTFTDVSVKSGMENTIGTYGLSVVVADLDNDGWPDIYVANDSTAATFYQNQKDGTFKDLAIEAGIAYSPDGKPQAGMGVAVGDYNRDGLLDIVKTNFAGDTDSLYQNLGDGTFEDHTYLSGLGINTRYLGWGVGFVDLDNDGWLDIFISNGHVYPEVDGSHLDARSQAGSKRHSPVRPTRSPEVAETASPPGSGTTRRRILCHQQDQRRAATGVEIGKAASPAYTVRAPASALVMPLGIGRPPPAPCRRAA